MKTLKTFFFILTGIITSVFLNNSCTDKDDNNKGNSGPVIEAMLVVQGNNNCNLSTTFLQPLTINNIAFMIIADLTALE